MESDRPDSPCELPKARPYQEELLATAKLKNSLICLGTGAGKTYIAVMLISHLSHELEPPYEENGKRTFFLVPSRPLVKQQASEIVKKSRFDEKDVGEYTGDMNVDYWSKDDWLVHLRSKKVFVMTRQIFLNMLNSAAVPLKKVNLLIFDEAHHAAPKAKKKGKPTKDCYKLIMDHIHSRPESEHPRILGLSASLINANSNAVDLQQTIEDLEGTYKSSCTSVTDLDDVRKYATDPKESVWEYDSDNAVIGFECNHVHELLSSARRIFLEMYAYKDTLRRQNEENDTEENIGQVPTTPTTCMAISLPIGVEAFEKCESMISLILSTMGPWCAIVACEFYIQEFASYIELYENSYPAFCSIIITVNDMMQTVMGLLKYNFYIHQVSLTDMLLKYSSNKMQRLLDLLMQYSDPSEPLAGIVFVQRRAICKALSTWLQKVKEVNVEYDFLSSDYIVGEAARPGFANKIAVKAAQLQKKTLNKFRTGDLNLLVATSILEEGLDVTQCNLVVRYDGVDTFRQWVQSQGRARSKHGRFVIFSDRTLVPETKRNLGNFKDLFRQLQTIATGGQRTNPSSSSNNINTDREDEMQLTNAINGARVTLDTAKTVVFMYCSRLPSDAFFSTKPYETLSETAKDFRCVIRLPINSAVKRAIEGPVKSTESKACKAAYLEVCRVLREEDEIDESFVPYTKAARLKKIIDEFNLTCSIEDNAEKFDGPKPGTVKRRQIYSKSFEKMFASSPIKSSTSTCIYSIGVEPKTGSKSIGFICSEYVPLSNIVASFPVYMRTGEYKISVAAVDTTFRLSPEQLDQVQLFHQVVFHESLGFKRKQLKFDQSSPVYVVPLNDNFGIDWNMIHVTLDRNKTNAMIISKNVADEQPFTFNKSDYNDAMVFRRYDPTGLFEVLNVGTKTPSSRFPNNGYKTYEDYYVKKYDLKIVHPFPLLCVEPIGFNSSIKQLTPTRAEQKRKTIELVPELLLIFPIPTSLHRQCRLLPAIFYRLCQFYNVEQLRARISTEANFGWAAANHNWGPLCVDCAQHQKIIRNFDKSTDSGPNSDDNEQSVEDCNEMEVECESLVQIIKDVDISLSSADIYGDVDELKRKFSNFHVKAYTDQMRKKLFLDYKELLQAPVLNCDLGDHSQYLPQISGTLKDRVVDFHRVKSFDHHTTENMVGPSPSLILQALTTNKAMDMFNMERLETLGDSFLKLTTSGYFYYKLPMLNEGYLSLLKVNQISNRNLHRLGTKKNLAQLIVGHQFQPCSTWLPPGFYADMDVEKRHKKDGEFYNAYTNQKISDKSVADCCEALIGAYILSSGPTGAVNFMTWLGLRIMDPMTAESNNGHWLPSPRSPQAAPTCGDSEIKIRNLSSTLTEFEERIGYKFRDKCFLIQAMTHVSYHDNTVTDCYQRLEFLGDAVLDYLITRYIYEDPKRFRPGDLTDLRAALTNNAFFGSLAVKHRFHVYLKMSSYDLYRSIHSFADKLLTNTKDVVYGNFLTLLDERETQTSDEIEVPKALGDVFESVAGAVYLDSNYSLDAVWRVYYPLMEVELEKFSQNIPKSPLSLLYIKFPKSVKFSEVAVSNKREVSVTVTVKHKGGTFTEDGYGKNRYWAKSSAAKRALKRKI